MRSYRFTDDAGQVWDVTDYVTTANFKKKRLPIGDFAADGRAFVPVGREGPVMIHRFGFTPYRDVDARTLRAQLELAKPSTATAGERL